MSLQGSVNDIDIGDIITTKYKIDNGTVQFATGTVTTSGSFANTLINVGYFSEGSHNLTVWAEDDKSGISSSLVIPFKLDKTSPQIGTFLLTSSSSDITMTASVTDSIAGLSQAPYRYTIGTATTWITNNSYKKTGLLPNAQFPVKFEVSDAVGNIASITSEIYTKAAIPNLSTSNITPYGLTLNTSDNNPTNTQYLISVVNNGTKYVTQEGSLTTSPAWITLTNKKINVTELTPSQTYSFTAKARNAENTETTVSPTVSATTLIQPSSPPTNITATATSSSINVLWDPVAGSTSYEIEVDGVVKNNSTYTSYTHTGLNQNTPHTYRIRAKNAGGTGDWSTLITKYTQQENPNTPFNIDAAATNTSIIVTWQPISGATNYDIEVDGEIVNNYSSTNYVHTGLIPGTTHSYRVRSINSAGRSPWSQEIVVTTQTEAPPVPENLTAAAGRDQITVTWDEIDGATYEIEVDGNIKDNGTSTTYIHSNLAGGSEHSYRVRTKLSGNTSAWSAIETATVPEAVFGTPTNIKAEATDTTVTLSWSPVLDATGYEVDIDGVILPNGTDTSCVFNSLTPNNTYTYSVRALGDGQESDWSDPITITTYALPTPKNVEVFATGDVISINWDAVEAAESYDLEINDELIDGITDTNYTYEGEPNEQYSFRVRAVSVDGTSNWSPIARESTEVTAPDVPSGIIAKSTTDAIYLLWNPMPDADSYELEIDGANIESIGTATYQHVGLTPGEQHSYRVRAVIDGQQGQWSNAMLVKTLPIAPTVPANITTSSTMSSILITWEEAEHAVEYELEIDGQIINAGINTKYLHNGLLPDTEHTYRVRAISSTAQSLWSDPVTIRTKSSVQTYTLEATVDQVFNLTITANEITDPTKYTYTINYNPEELELIDLCGATSRIDMSIGNLIGTDIQVLQYTSGTIVFKKLGNAIEQAWTGYINTIKFKSKKDGETQITYSIQ